MHDELSATPFEESVIDALNVAEAFLAKGCEKDDFRNFGNGVLTGLAMISGGADKADMPLPHLASMLYDSYLLSIE